MAVIKKSKGRNPRAATTRPKTEGAIQDALYHRVGLGLKHTIVLPNVHFWGWESDLVSVSKAGYAYEYEIKVSRADFLAEKRAVERARVYAQDPGSKPGHLDAKGERDRLLAGDLDCPSLHLPGKVTEKKRQRLERSRPARFWYVTTPGVVESVDEVPEYAGWMEIESPKGKGMVYKDAPLLHRHKLTAADYENFARLLTFRVWKARAPS